MRWVGGLLFFLGVEFYLHCCFWLICDKKALNEITISGIACTDSYKHTISWLLIGKAILLFSCQQSCQTSICDPDLATCFQFIHVPLLLCNIGQKARVTAKRNGEPFRGRWKVCYGFLRATKFCVLCPVTAAGADISEAINIQRPGDSLRRSNDVALFKILTWA